MPLEGGGLPGVGCGWRGGAAESFDEVKEKEELGGGEEDGGVGDEAVQWEGGGEELAGGVGDSCELGVVAGLCGETGEVHGQEGGVGA